LTIGEDEERLLREDDDNVKEFDNTEKVSSESNLNANAEEKSAINDNKKADR
jgi:hypothetical protein